MSRLSKQIVKLDIEIRDLNLEDVQYSIFSSIVDEAVQELKSA